MIIARIKDGIVINNEVADQDWLDQNQNNNDGYVFIVIETDSLPVIGSAWSPEHGFEVLEDNMTFEEYGIPDDDEIAKEVEKALAGE